MIISSQGVNGKILLNRRETNHTEAPQAVAKAVTRASLSATGVVLAGEAWGEVYGESTPKVGMLSENPVAVAFMNLASATSRVGEDQRGDAESSDGTAQRKQCLAHSRGGHSRTACVKVSSSAEHLGQIRRTGSATH